MSTEVGLGGPVSFSIGGHFQDLPTTPKVLFRPMHADERPMYPFGPKTLSQQELGQRDAHFVGQGNYEEKRQQILRNADAGNRPLG